MAIEPDTKDWTWVLHRECPECGLAASDVDPSTIAALVRSSAVWWTAVLARSDVRERPDESTWSALEYGCHVRDVFEVFERRLALMLNEDDPLFDNWDQDATAAAGDYAHQDPAGVAIDLGERAERFAAELDAVGDRWSRTGRRSNGSVFTVATLAQYGWHDVWHHLRDVGAPSGAEG